MIHIGVCEKTLLSSEPFCPAKQQSRLLASPWFGVFQANTSQRLHLRRSVFHRHRQDQQTVATTTATIFGLAYLVNFSTGFDAMCDICTYIYIYIYITCIQRIKHTYIYIYTHIYMYIDWFTAAVLTVRRSYEWSEASYTNTISLHIVIIHCYYNYTISLYIVIIII